MNQVIKKLSIIMLTFFCSAAIAVIVEASPSGSSSLSDGITKGNNDFNVELYHMLSNAGGNLLFSPYSISTALGMTYGGARGNTAVEMKKTLHFQFDQTRLGKGFKNMDKQLMAAIGKDGQKLRIANGLCTTGGKIAPDYKAFLEKYYDAELFAGGLDKINAWVSKKTEGKITEILKELNPNSVCVILNAIYFKGQWENQFQKEYTHKSTFRVSATKQVQVPLMYQSNNMKMIQEKGVQAVEIPYKGNLLSMVILLPDTPDGLAGLEKQVTSANLDTWLTELDMQPARKTDLFLPRFKSETEYDLIGAFKAMGMKDPFSATADFSGMGWPKGSLWISQIVHKAYIEVNEVGTEAAAATGVEMATKSVPYFAVFRADHPFLYLIRDNRRGTILFMGRMDDPTAN